MAQRVRGWSCSSGCVRCDTAKGAGMTPLHGLRRKFFHADHGAPAFLHCCRCVLCRALCSLEALLQGWRHGKSPAEDDKGCQQPLGTPQCHVVCRWLSAGAAQGGLACCAAQYCVARVLLLLWCTPCMLHIPLATVTTPWRKGLSERPRLTASASRRTRRRQPQHQRCAHIISPCALAAYRGSAAPLG